jgi:hypothetical protein
MNIAFSAIDDVYTITNRPDLVKETQLAVKSATLQLHRSDYFYKDIFETALQFQLPAFIQAIDYRVLFPRYRALKYLRKYFAGSISMPGQEFTIITPDQIFDSYGAQKIDVAYTAGAVIQLKSSTAIEYLLIGIYQNPDVDVDRYYSWIDQEAHYAIVYKAASIVFGTVLGDTARQNANAQLAQLEMVEVINSNIQAEGY